MQLADFFENFEVLAAAPGGVARLREAVLSLAVRGRLVAQDPGDEPASVLLERIKQEKVRLVKDGKIKKSKPLPLISPDEIPFDLPDSWEWARLNDVTKLITDGEHQTPTRILEKEIPLATAKNIRDGFLDLSTTDFVSYVTARKCWSRCHPKSDDILMVCVGATTGRLCLLNNPPSMVLVRSVALIRAMKSSVYPRYLEKLMKSKIVQKQVWGNVKQSAQPCLYIGKMQSILIPLPPLVEQKRIVEAVDRLMEQLDRLEAQQTEQRDRLQILGTTATTQLTGAAETRDRVWPLVRDRFATIYNTPENVEQLRQTILQLAVMGRLVPQDPNDEPASVLLERIREEKARLVKEKKIKPSKPLPPISPNEIHYELPKSWEWIQLSNISDIGTGTTPPKSNPEYYQSGIMPWITSSLTSHPKIDFSEKFITSKAVLDCRLRIYRPGSLIIALYGQGKTRGQVSKLGIEATVNQACAAISFFKEENILGDYIFLVFKKQYDELRQAAAGGAQPNLNVQKIKEALIPLPPLAEQKRIVATVDRLMAHCDQLQTQLQTRSDRARTLLDSAIHQLSQVA